MAASYIYANWMNQEMPGSLVEVPGNSGGEGGGYGNSHMICSSYLEGLVDCIKAHGSTTNDQNTPRGYLQVTHFRIHEIYADHGFYCAC